MMNRISVPDSSGFRFTRRFFCFLLGLMMTVFLVLPVFAGAQESGQKLVRVGWFESSFCYWDAFGRRCGMD